MESFKKELKRIDGSDVFELDSVEASNRRVSAGYRVQDTLITRIVYG